MFYNTLDTNNTVKTIIERRRKSAGLNAEVTGKILVAKILTFIIKH